jgi:hypothetical protein
VQAGPVHARPVGQRAFDQCTCYALRDVHRLTFLRCTLELTRRFNASEDVRRLKPTLLSSIHRLVPTRVIVVEGGGPPEMDESAAPPNRSWISLCSLAGG